MKKITGGRIEGLVVAAAFAAFLFAAQRASATCTNPDVNWNTCYGGSTNCCDWGTCTWDWDVSAQGGFVCEAANGYTITGSYDGTANCISRVAVDAGADAGNAAICAGRDTADLCDDDSQCASWLCAIDAGVIAPEDGGAGYEGSCVPDGYKGPCSIGYTYNIDYEHPSYFTVNVGAGCDSGNCVMHDSTGGVCGLPFKDAGTAGTPCADSSWCWAKGFYTCDLDQGPNQNTCVAACQSDGAECQDAGLKDCCGTDVCVDSVCRPCVVPGGACVERYQCCNLEIPGPGGETPIWNLSSCSSFTHTCGYWGPGSQCLTSEDCQDPNWYCGSGTYLDHCLPIPASELGCTRDYDCTPGSICVDAGALNECCYKKDRGDSFQTQCCSNADHALYPYDGAFACN
jgi:hypothetical protein